ncbi:MAG TPA: DciA family protein [Mycobacteriales bacterium]|nr:DciA family protein [Mycobacteriales bacterium]
MSDDRPDPGARQHRDAARRLLARARSAKPVAPSRRVRKADPADQPWSGARDDPRDPQRFGDAVSDLVRERDWSRTLTEAGLLPRWEQIVGTEIAAHCRPERLVAGELRCVAESTAWATQLRLMAAALVGRIAAEIGPGVVNRIVVRGPSAPDWRHGPLRVTGRGPRDTYG